MIESGGEDGLRTKKGREYAREDGEHAYAFVNIGKGKNADELVIRSSDSGNVSD